ncbi:MAG: gamma-glutamyl-phosphate reductase, partial [Merismopedia sp. SIO2A8]|nr:gamma-glutamyl-phosphate reductase [Merismopedia sp. SIO2A8]
MITEIVQDALNSVTKNLQAVQLLPTDQSEITRELLTLKSHIQLLIPYGRPSLIQQVIKQANVPVLKTGIGNNYLYCSPNASID